MTPAAKPTMSDSTNRVLMESDPRIETLDIAMEERRHGQLW
jgi:hypothetical protein